MLLYNINLRAYTVEPKISVAQFDAICEQQLPFASLMGLKLESLDNQQALMRAQYSETHLRPGGTVSGPIMMGLADAAMYALVLSHIGLVELAVTTNLSINFLRKPSPGDVMAQARMLKLGQRLAVGEVALFSEGGDASMPVAHVTATYSIPPEIYR